MKPRCPKCKSDNIQKTSRRKYLVRAALCLAVILAWSMIFATLQKESDDNDVYIMLVISAILAGCVLIAGIYLLVKAIRTSQTIYYCNFCDKRIDTPLIVKDTKAFDTLQQIRRD